MPDRLALPCDQDPSLDSLKERIRRLSRDDAFGMLTRPALLNHAQRLPPGAYFVVFLDLDHLHALNARLGYEEVNRRVRGAFASLFRHTDLIGRWQSGDELVIILPHVGRVVTGALRRLQRATAAHDLSFTYAFSAWRHPDEGFSIVAHHLARMVALRKEVGPCQPGRSAAT